jgi:hypothetical protein
MIAAGRVAPQAPGRAGVAISNPHARFVNAGRRSVRPVAAVAEKAVCKPITLPALPRRPAARRKQCTRTACSLQLRHGGVAGAGVAGRQRGRPRLMAVGEPLSPGTPAALAGPVC